MGAEAVGGFVDFPVGYNSQPKHFTRIYADDDFFVGFFPLQDFPDFVCRRVRRGFSVVNQYPLVTYQVFFLFGGYHHFDVSGHCFARNYTQKGDVAFF